MLPLLVSWTMTSTRGSLAAMLRATSALSSGEASSMISTRTFDTGWSSSTLATASSRKWP
jgi:hypothetical protein